MFTYILMGHNNHSLSLDATTMVSKHCPTIGEYIVIIFGTQKVTIATVRPAKNTPNYSVRGLQFKKRHGEFFLFYHHLINMIRGYFVAKFKKKICRFGFRATLNFRP